MCKNCAVWEDYAPKTRLHVGYLQDGDNWFDQMMNGQMVFEVNGEGRSYSPKDWLVAWDRLEEEGLRNTGGDLGCDVCGRGLTTVPGVDAECAECGTTKHEEIREIWQERQRIQEEMEHWEETRGFGAGKRPDPREIAARLGLQCPEGHWICTDCHVIG